MKKIVCGTMLVVSLFFLTGCDEKILSELKTRNEELRIENVSLKAQVNELERNIATCNKKYNEHLGKYTPQTNPNDNPSL